jgi:Surface antigen variable number repeat
MSPMARAQSSNDRPKVAIDVVELEGTLLPQPIQERLVASIKQREYDEDSDWIKEVGDIVGRAETEGWPDRENQGYLGFSVSAQCKALRREPGMLHVSVTVRVNEGKQKRLKAIEFRYVGDRLGRPVLDSDNLRKLIPLNYGEICNRDNYYAGLSAVSGAYIERGFMDCTVGPTMELDDVNQTISIVIDINEGPQYQWRDIRVTGLNPKIETLLRVAVDAR